MNRTRLATLAALLAGVWVVLWMQGRSSVEGELSGIEATDLKEVEAQAPTQLDGPSTQQRADALPAAVDASVALAPSGPRGRLVSKTSGAGIGGIAVHLVRAGKLIERTVTRLDGSFALQAVGVSGDWIEAKPDPRFRFEPQRHGIGGELEGNGTQPIALWAYRHASAPAHGLVLDVRTKEPVPMYRLWIYDGVGNDEALMTDGEGRFQGSENLIPGPRKLICVDATDQGEGYDEQHVVVEDAAEQLQIEVEVGPTYRVLVTLPEGLRIEDQWAQVRSTHPDTDPSDQPQRFSRMRAGQPPWVRLMIASTCTSPGPYELFLTSEDGLYAGRAQVESASGIQPAPVAVAMQPCGAVRGRIMDQHRNVPRGLTIRLTSKAGAASLSANVSEGNFGFLGVPPGEWNVEIRGRGVEPWSQVRTVTAGEPLVLVCEVHSRPAHHARSGRLRTRSGNTRPEASVVLVDADQHEWPCELTWKESQGTAEASVVAEGLPTGTYTVLARLAEGDWKTQAIPETLEVSSEPSPAGGSFEVWIEDGGDAR